MNNHLHLPVRNEDRDRFHFDQKKTGSMAEQFYEAENHVYFMLWPSQLSDLNQDERLWNMPQCSPPPSTNQTGIYLMGERGFSSLQQSLRDLQNYL